MRAYMTRLSGLLRDSKRASCLDPCKGAFTGASSFAFPEPGMTPERTV
jgi:hypothetical protein